MHDEPDPDWLLRPAVDEGLTLLTERRLTLDLTAHTPTLLAHVATLAEQPPEADVSSLDHLGAPPLAALRAGARDGWTRWSALLGAVAQQPNVVAKLSGLATAAGAGWTPDHLRPAVDRALEVFGPDRLMLGSDWPYALLEGDSYAHVWHGLRSHGRRAARRRPGSGARRHRHPRVRAPVRRRLTDARGR